MAKKYTINLSEPEIEKLRSLIKSGRNKARVITRGRILLMSFEGRIDSEIATALKVSIPTVERTRAKYALGGLDMVIHEKPHPPKRTKLNLKQEAHLIAIGSNSLNEQAWSLKLLAGKIVQRIADANNQEAPPIANEVKSALDEQWSIPQGDAEYALRMEDLLDLYSQPYNPERPVICFDIAELPEEVCSYPLIDNVSEPIPPKSRQRSRSNNKSKRNSCVNLLAMLQPLNGWRHIEVTRQRAKKDFALQIKDLIDVHFTHATQIHLVVNNLSKSIPGTLYEVFQPQEARRIVQKLKFHYTPKDASWLNQVKIELSVLSHERLERKIPDVATLVAEIAAWEKERNNQKMGVNWCFSITDARTKMKRLYPNVLPIKNQP
jgi:transposase